MALAVLLFLSISNSYANETVTIGPTYPIAESDLLQELKSHLAQQSKNLNAFQAQPLDRPSPVPGLSPALISRTWDIPWPERSAVNLSFSRQLIFWNGDDKKEQAWVEAHRASWDHPVLILVQGSVSDVSSLLNTKIYFDQNGMLTRRFGVQHTPTVIDISHGKITGEEATP
jgi:conjugal transfer pilus assembly protein TraW